MKAIFISYNQAFGDEVTDMLEAQGQRGYTLWSDIQGRGGIDGEPHLGNHAWPTMNCAVLAVVPDDRAVAILEEAARMDRESPDLGLRAFQWNVEQAI